MKRLDTIRAAIRGVFWRNGGLRPPISSLTGHKFAPSEGGVAKALGFNATDNANAPVFDSALTLEPVPDHNKQEAILEQMKLLSGEGDVGFADSADSAAWLIQNQYTRKGKLVLLVGKTVFATLNGAAPPPAGEFVKQHNRYRETGLKLGKRKPLYCWVSGNALDVLKAAKSDVALAVDSILAYGSKIKGRVLVINGVHTPEETILNLYEFENGKLVELSEQFHPPVEAYRFAGEISRLAKDYLQQHPNGQIHWTAPLKPIELPNIQNVGMAPFLKPVKKAVSAKAAHNIRVGQAKIPLLLLISAASSYAGVTLYYQGRYEDSHRRYMLITANTPSMAEPVDILKVRKEWASAPKVINPRIKQLEAGLEAIGRHPDWIVGSITVPTTQPGAGDPNMAKSNSPIQSEFSILLRMPRKEGQGPLEQAQPILSELSQAMGITLAVPEQGWQDLDESGHKWLQLTIKGSAEGMQEAH